MAPFTLLFILIFVVPILVSIYSSFFKLKATGGGAFGGGEKTNIFVGFENFQYVLTSSDFWTGIGRVILYTLFQVPVMIIAALALALLIDSYLVKRVTVFRLGYFLPYAVPGVVAAIIWMYIYTPGVSPFNSIAELFGTEFPINFFGHKMVILSMANMTTWTFTGYNMLIFLAALQAIPHDLYEAARLDGANGWQIVTKIKIPMVRGAALLAILLSIVGTIQLYNEPQVLSTANSWMEYDYTPMMMALSTAKNQITPGGEGPASAIAIVMALIAGVLAVLYFLADRKIGGSND
ncbi:MAG: sugar ABC transporter permease [Actinomycetaceae bacterium]|nr:sugar ABC transporter permease [Arcanobacterium sp.]MDD7686841.1 sugar ABC transporter permease [Actinomycetaceae bacterium]MDY5274067.1 sugar ABC transporter permease [Arcanobacterium sp.]